MQMEVTSTTFNRGDITRVVRKEGGKRDENNKIGGGSGGGGVSEET